jgi:hypothetical protein
LIKEKSRGKVRETIIISLHFSTIRSVCLLKPLSPIPHVIDVNKIKININQENKN